MKRMVIFLAHLQKNTKAACGHLTKHYERGKDEGSEYIKFGNQDIDISRTHLNYNRADLDQPLDQMEFIKKRISEVKCQNRADVKVMCSWVITAPKDLEEHEQSTFFTHSYIFLKERYGAENVVSAYVHLDETRPHMHFSFVPVVSDKKNPGRYKVSAKELITKKDLQSFHTDLDRWMEKVFGRKIEILNGSTRDGNKSIHELKKGIVEKDLQDLIIKKESLSKNIEVLAESVDSLKSQKNYLKTEIDNLHYDLSDKYSFRVEYETKKAFVEQCIEDSKASKMYPDYAKVTEKGLIKKEKFVTVPAEKWEQKHVSAMHVSSVLEARDTLESNIRAINNSNLFKNAARLQDQIDELEKELNQERSKNQEFASELKKKERESDKIIEKINKVIKVLPEDMAAEFISAWNKQKNKEKNRDQSR